MQFADEEYYRLVESILAHNPPADRMNYSEFIDVDLALEPQLHQSADVDQIVSEVLFQAAPPPPCDSCEQVLPVILAKDLVAALEVLRKLDQHMPGKFQSTISLLSSQDVRKLIPAPKQASIQDFVKKQPQ
jgi:hypothetical protein